MNPTTSGIIKGATAAVSLGRVTGTGEMVVRPNYIVVYAFDAHKVYVLRVLHAAQRWPNL
jgi:plasmid stabilization system protein ParE